MISIQPLLGAGAALVLAASLASPAAASPTAERRVAPVRITGSNAAFSPNGDGSKDVGVVTYRLAKPGAVTVTIRRGGVPVVTKKLGRQSKGTKTFRWNGKRAGKVVKDGTYVVTVASRGGKARTPLEVDARFDADAQTTRLLLSSDTVHPRTTVIRDVVVADVVPSAAFYRGGSPFEDTTAFRGVRGQVLDTAGTVVDTVPVTTFAARYSPDACSDECGRLTWDGRDSKDRIVPLGSYRLRAVKVSPAGNTTVVSPAVAVSVSATQLVARTTTTTTTAAGGTKDSFYRDPDEYMNWPIGAPEPCRPGPQPVTDGSAQATGSLSFDTTYYYFDQYSPRVPCVDQAAFTGELPTRRTPYDTFSVTATGRPGDGTSATAAVNVCLSPDPETCTKLSGPDASVTITQPLRADTETARPDAKRAVSWQVYSASDAAYDVATFTYTLTQYVPAS